MSPITARCNCTTLVSVVKLLILMHVVLCVFCVFQVLQERFTKFASETNSIGQQRMEQVNKMVNEMIDCGHSDAATIAEWKDGLNESWADLLELMETRRQMLAASHQLHKFFTDCKEVKPKQNSNCPHSGGLCRFHFRGRQSGRDMRLLFLKHS